MSFPTVLASLLVVAAAAAPGDTVVIPSGWFRMGATAADLERASALCTRALRESGALDAEIGPRCRARPDVEGGPLEVFVSSFAIDRTEVTFAAYQTCVRAGACPALPRWLAERAQRRQRDPAEAITFAEAARYCAFRGARLPSEAEWERAARGSDTRFFPWGNQEPGGTRANHGAAVITPVAGGLSAGEAPSLQREHEGDGFARAAPVGSFPHGASPFGVMDMAGNVWEWTTSFFAARAAHPHDVVDPRGPASGDERVVRGGGYRSPPAQLRVTARHSLPASTRLPTVGFRCVSDRPPG